MPTTMIRPDVTDVLNRLLRVLCRSMPRYLEQAKPWAQSDHDKHQEALADLVADQGLMARRVARAVIGRGGQPDPGPFPAAFASLNDAALDRLLPRLVDHQQRDVAEVRCCVAALADAPEERALAEEVLGNLQGHLEILEERMKAEG